MKPASGLPQKIVELYNATLLAHLPPPERSAPYALIPAPELGYIMGVPWWLAMTRDLAVPTVFDAGSAPALAASAFRSGIEWVVCTSCGPSLNTVREIARLCGGQVLTNRPPAITLGRPPHNAYRIAQLHQFLAPDT